MRSTQEPGEQSFGLTLDEWSRALSLALRETASVVAVSAMPASAIKAGGLSETVMVDYADAAGRRCTCLAKRNDACRVGETDISDHMRDGAWRLRGYRAYPGHVRCLGVALFSATQPVSVLGAAPERVVSFEDYAPGTPYGELLATTHLQSDAEAETLARRICAFMTAGHAAVDAHARIAYRRSLRISLVDSFLRTLETADNFWGTRTALRDEIELRMMSWRRRLADLEHRVRSIHCDFHPWNVLVDGERIAALGRRLPGVGDPVNDLAALAVNYIWFKLQNPAHAHRYEALYRAFWEDYLTRTGDAEAVLTAAPYFAVRCAVLVSPLWYPSTSLEIRERLTQVLVNVLAEKWSVRDDVHRF